MYHIRPAKIDDNIQLSQMWHTLLQEQSRLDPRFDLAEDAVKRWQNDFKEWVESKAHCLLVAEEGETLMGFASGMLWNAPPIYAPGLEVYVNEIYISPENRRKGIGRALVEELREWARSKQARRLRMGVLMANEEGRTFWHACEGTPLSVTMTVELAPMEEAESRKKAGLGFLGDADSGEK